MRSGPDAMGGRTQCGGMTCPSCPEGNNALFVEETSTSGAPFVGPKRVGDVVADLKHYFSWAFSQQDEQTAGALSGEGSDEVAASRQDGAPREREQSPPHRAKQDAKAAVKSSAKKKTRRSKFASMQS